MSILALAAMPARGVASRAPGLGPEDVERAFHEHGVTTFLATWHMRRQAAGVRRLIETGHRDDLRLIAEIGLPFRGSIRRGWVRNARALGTDRIDVMLFGWVRRPWHIRHTWPELLRLKEEGKVGAIGFSCHRRRLAAELARELDVDVLMIRYNAAHRGAENDVFEPLGASRPGIIAYTATRWGMLLRPLPKRGFPRAMTAPECYRFAIGNPAVDTVLFAPLSAAELAEDAAGVLDGPLSKARLEEVRRFGDAVHAAARGRFRWAFR